LFEDKEMIIAALIAQAVVSVPPALQKKWQWSDYGQTMTIQITPKEYIFQIKGAGLPERGFQERLTIAAHQQNPDRKSGVLVIGPNANNINPFSTIHYYNLTANNVRFLMTGKQYKTTAEALAAPDQADLARIFKVVP
jgi:hypothetical protein